MKNILYNIQVFSVIIQNKIHNISFRIAVFQCSSSTRMKMTDET